MAARGRAGPRSSWRASRAKRAGPRAWRTRLALREWSRRGRPLSDEREERVFEAGAGLAGLAPQLVERALRDQSATGDDADAVGHALGNLEDVRGHDDRGAGAGALDQHVL